MSLTFIGPAGAFERRWIVYAIFRDNVQHHLDPGNQSSDFGAILALGDALGRGQQGVDVNASQLRTELLIVKDRLLQVPIQQLAISLRTRAVTNHKYPLPDLRQTELVEGLQWDLPFPTDGANILGDVFGTFVDELLQVIGAPEPTDSVRVVDA